MNKVKWMYIDICLYWKPTCIEKILLFWTQLKLMYKKIYFTIRKIMKNNFILKAINLSTFEENYFKN
jgi:hypothetical protein